MSAGTNWVGSASLTPRVYWTTPFRVVRPSPSYDARKGGQLGCGVGDDRSVPLTVTTDHAEITAVLDRYLATEPVRYTILGTISASLEDTAWAVLGEERLAVRSG